MTKTPYSRSQCYNAEDHLAGVLTNEKIMEHILNKADEDDLRRIFAKITAARKRVL